MQSSIINVYRQKLWRNQKDHSCLAKRDEDAVATPANWLPGDDTIIPPASSCGVAKERMETSTEDKYCLDWFLCFKKEKK